MHPILFYVTDDFYIGTYGVLLAIGILAGVLLALRRAKKQGVPQEAILDITFYSIIAGMIGARLVFIIVSFRDFLQAPLAYIFSRQGFVFQGGIIAALVVAYLYIRRKHLHFWQIADVVAPSIPLAHFFGRLGCFSAGCCFGKVCSTGLAKSFCVRFPLVLNQKGEPIGSFAFLDQLSHGLLKPGALYSLPVYPTQLLEAGANLIICAVLLLLTRRSKFQGQLFLLYLIFYSTARFFIEFLRGDVDRGMFFNSFSVAQFISIGVIIAAIYLWTFLRKRRVAT
jgi:phosphatidylglycerol:prolipoprotein diacylglycerol transferase